MTTCPSGVHYMHLVDHARDHIEATYRRPLADRLLRALLATVLPRPRLFRFALIGGKLGQPLARWMPRRLAALAAMLPRRVPSPSSVDAPQTFPAEGARRKRVTLLSGCAQQVLAPEINEATIRLLTRHGCDVVVAKGAGCCGGLVHHMGRPALAFAKANIDAWTRVLEAGGLDAIVINTSGCGVTVKDYGYMLREDKDYAAKAARISALAKDVAEIMTELGLRPSVAGAGGRVAYHAACSLQHGQKLCREPQALLGAAGFTVLEVPEGHLCCGSAGTYNMLQPTIAAELQLRKVASIESTRPELIAAGNIGCIEQIARATALPVRAYRGAPGLGHRWPEAGEAQPVIRFPPLPLTGRVGRGGRATGARSGIAVRPPTAPTPRPRSPSARPSLPFPPPPRRRCRWRRRRWSSAVVPARSRRHTRRARRASGPARNC